MTRAILLVAMMVASAPAWAVSSYFTGTDILFAGNTISQNGCCGYVQTNIAAFSANPGSANVIISNYWRSVVLWIDDMGGGYFRAAAVFSDWNGGFNPWTDYLNPSYGNRVYAYSDPQPFHGTSQAEKIEIYWDMSFRGVSFTVNGRDAHTNYGFSTGPSPGFQVNYAQSAIWYLGGDSPVVNYYPGRNTYQQMMGANGVPQVTDLVQMQLFDYTWNFGPAFNAHSPPGQIGTVWNSFAVNLGGNLGATLPVLGPAAYVDFYDLTLTPEW